MAEVGYDSSAASSKVGATDWMGNLPAHLHDVPLYKLAIPGKITSPFCLVSWMPTSRSSYCGFEPRPSHTKDVKIVILVAVSPGI